MIFFCSSVVKLLSYSLCFRKSTYKYFLHFVAIVLTCRTCILGQIELRTPFCAAHNASPCDLHRYPKFDFNPEIFNEIRKNSLHFCHFTYESRFNLVVLSCHSLKIYVSATTGQRDCRSERV